MIGSSVDPGSAGLKTVVGTGGTISRADTGGRLVGGGGNNFCIAARRGVRGRDVELRQK